MVSYLYTFVSALYKDVDSDSIAAFLRLKTLQFKVFASVCSTASEAGCSMGHVMLYWSRGLGVLLV